MTTCLDDEFLVSINYDLLFRNTKLKQVKTYYILDKIFTIEMTPIVMTAIYRYNEEVVHFHGGSHRSSNPLE